MNIDDRQSKVLYLNYRLANMTTAPEKISIKRRRTDEPVEHLFYQSKKQRTANHVFVRQAVVKPQSTNLAGRQPLPVSTVTASSGIPSIKTSQPGDEVRDFQKYRAAKGLPPKIADNLAANVDLSQGRRFHLTRDLSIAVRSQQSAIVSKSKPSIRPHLPTFVERSKSSETRQLDTIDVKPPIDRLLRTDSSTQGQDELDQILAKDPNVQRKTIPAFAKPEVAELKTGRSIQDHPSTWDLDSDELANELNALALEMDPEAKAAYVAESEHSVDSMQVDSMDDYVFETYIRMQQDAMTGVELNPTVNFGILVIDEEDEDLWDQYLREEDEDDDDWDSEDEDSNAEDNPRNEYPDEEVSSDDEFGKNLYKYRRGCSDDEQFDEDD